MPRHRLALFITAGIVLVLAAIVVGVHSLRSDAPRDRVLKTLGVDMALQEAESPAPPGMRSKEHAVPADEAYSLAPSRVIRTAKLSLEVQDWSRFDRAMRELAGRYGYLASAEVNAADNGKHRAQITLRVEASRFDRALQDFKALGAVKSERIGAEDVSRAYTDLEARRANKRVTAARLRELISNRAGKLADVIQAEQALGEVTEEIERLDALKRGYDSQIAYSTLQAEVFEPAGRPAEPSLLKPLKDALLDTRTTLIAMAAFVLETLLVLAPWALLGWLGWSRFRKRRDRAAATTEAAP